MTAKRFQKLLIANRGEIACRIIRTARALGLTTVAVYSEADANAPHVELADEAQPIGPSPAKESYLDIDRLLAAARASGAEAVHPGYGFLSENAGFARAIETAGLVFVGPPPRAIDVMGDKAGAKRAMIAAGVPTVPGYEDEDQSDARLVGEARRIGFPVMVKASAGGGGRGMRLVERAEDLPEALIRARAESLNAFGSDRLILERALIGARHVEIQVFGDSEGQVIHLGERDCSVQRRHQKVIEEAPSPALTPDLRERMGAAAVEAARAVSYVGAGTVEFLLDDEGRFYFLEMNTRLQVEHPVTEMIFGLDLVAWQLRVAMGEPLPLKQTEASFSGHAIEARLYAEDPASGFLPSTGRLALWQTASGEGIRVDAGVATGFEVSPFYDPLLAKIIAYGETREIARRRLVVALERSVAFGVTTNADFLADILNQPDFVTGAATTAFITDHYPKGFTPTPAPTADIATAAALRLDADAKRALAASTLPDDNLLGFSSATPLAARLDAQIGGEIYKLAARPTSRGWSVANGESWRHEIELIEIAAPQAIVACDGRRESVTFQADADGGLALALRARRLTLKPARTWERAQSAGVSGQVVAPMPGVVAALHVKVGDRVKSGDPIAVLEAMKMQHTISARVGGIVRELFVTAGKQTSIGAPIAEIEEEAL